jgi:hypothetical protein
MHPLAGHAFVSQRLAIDEQGGDLRVEVGATLFSNFVGFPIRHTPFQGFPVRLYML